jgi:hypothetical protein
MLTCRRTDHPREIWPAAHLYSVRVCSCALRAVQGAEINAMGGSFGRIQGAAQWVKRIDNYAVYGALEGLHDNGFRNFSPSDVRRFYSDVGYKNDVSEFHLNVGLANNKFSAAATVPPNALRPKAGLLVTTSMDRTAVVGIRSQLTVSPKASLIRTRSGPAACLPREMPRSRGTNVR